jgi:L-fucose isomerase-like protein
MTTAIYTLTSQLHDEAAVDAVTQEFLGGLGIEYQLMVSDFKDYGGHDLELIYVRTGGTEGIFKNELPRMLRQSKQPFYLLTSGKSNSLAASMEILSYLRQQGLKGEILHGSDEYIKGRITTLQQVGKAMRALNGCRLGVIGEPSDWLIASQAKYRTIEDMLGIEIVNIDMDELLMLIDRIPNDIESDLLEKAPNEDIRQSLTGAERIYVALKLIVEGYDLQGFTIRCFDLLTAVKNTGCVALAKFNAQGIVASCEGDVPAMVSMKIAQAVTGKSGFQANPARINPETGEMLFAHCTIPLDMVESYELDTHFESGIGVGIRGFMKPGPVTIFKVSGGLGRHFAEEGILVENQGNPDLCRTQQVIQLNDKDAAKYFLTKPIGNHHIIMQGNYKAVLDEIL